MKKLVTTILAFIYLSTSMGATLHLHYCMGKLVSWGLVDHESRNCAFCGMPKKNLDKHCGVAIKGCCQDEHKQIKTDKDQKIAQSELQFLKLFPGPSDGEHIALPDIYVSSLTVEHPAANGPPQFGKVHIFLLNRNFRI